MISRSSCAFGLSALLVLAACGTVSADFPPDDAAPDAGVDDAHGPDAELPPPVDGRATGEMALSLPDGKLTLVRGTTSRVKFTLERKNGFAGAVTISLANAPAGLTAKPLELASDATTGDLELVVGKDVLQGELVGVSVEGSNPGLKDRASFPLAAFVRGAPGEIDTTYATDGVVTLGPLEFGLAAPGTGEFYTTGASPMKRYRADGTVDPSFSGIGFTEGTLAGNFVYGCSLSFPSGGEPETIVGASRVSILTGQRDTAFGSTSPVLSGNRSKYGCIASAAGNVALLGISYGITFPPYYGNVSWFNSAGTYTTSYSTPTPDDFRTGVFLADGIVVSTTTGIAKLKTGATALDTSFGAGGRVALSSGGRITNILEDADKKLLVANATYTARVTASGSLDGTFVPAATGLTPADAAVRLAVQNDGKILKGVQLGGGDGRACAITRYLPTGALDTTFGNQGSAHYPISPCSPQLLAVTPDGRILVGSPKVLRIWD